LEVLKLTQVALTPSLLDQLVCWQFVVAAMLC
jgi:hypothetical protein